MRQVGVGISGSNKSRWHSDGDTVDRWGEVKVTVRDLVDGGVLCLPSKHGFPGTVVDLVELSGGWIPNWTGISGFGKTVVTSVRSTQSGFRGGDASAGAVVALSN